MTATTAVGRYTNWRKTWISQEHLNDNILSQIGKLKKKKKHITFLIRNGTYRKLLLCNIHAYVYVIKHDAVSRCNGTRICGSNITLQCTTSRTIQYGAFLVSATRVVMGVTLTWGETVYVGAFMQVLKYHNRPEGVTTSSCLVSRWIVTVDIWWNILRWWVADVNKVQTGRLSRRVRCDVHLSCQFKGTPRKHQCRRTWNTSRTIWRCKAMSKCTFCIVWQDTFDHTNALGHVSCDDDQLCMTWSADCQRWYTRHHSRECTRSYWYEHIHNGLILQLDEDKFGILKKNVYVFLKGL